MEKSVGTDHYKLKIDTQNAKVIEKDELAETSVDSKTKEKSSFNGFKMNQQSSSFG